MFCNFKFTKSVWVLIIPVLMLMACGSAQADPVTVTSTVMPQGANYLYDFAITNNSSTDPYGQLISVDFSLPVGSVIGAATAPAGNGAATDPSGNFVEFTSDNVSGFAMGMMVDGFEFVSPTYFSSLTFAANYLDNAETTLTAFGGTTTPQAPASVPEPGTFYMTAGLALLLFSRMRVLKGR